MHARLVNGTILRNFKSSNVALSPPAPGEPLLREISAAQSNSGRAGRFHDDAYNVIPVRLGRNLGDPAIDAGRPDDLSLFMYVNRGFRRCYFVARTGFDFDKGECEWARRFVIRDDVNLARD